MNITLDFSTSNEWMCRMQWLRWNFRSTVHRHSIKWRRSSRRTGSIIFSCQMFFVSSFSWTTGLFVQTMCLIDRHLQVFLAISHFCIHSHRCISLSPRPYRVSIAGEMRPIFDLYLGHHPDNINQGDVLLVGHRRLTVPISRLLSFLCPRSANRTSTSSFSRTIIWRCYRTEKKKEKRCEQSGGGRPMPEQQKQNTRETREKTTVTANHASMMYNNRTPFLPSLSLSLTSLSSRLLFLSAIHICSSWP